MKTLGIVGGLGPLASALFYERLTRWTKASSDQEHIPLVLYSAPNIPDRSAFIMGQSTESPLPRLLSTCQKLAPLVDFVAIPCVTAHHFYDEVSESIDCPVANLLEICAGQALSDSVERLGIMATEGTVRSGKLQAVLQQRGVSPICPDPAVQSAVMRLIRSIKSGYPPDFALFELVCRQLISQGAQKILLGCTELSLFAESPEFSPVLYDASALLTQYCIITAGGTPLEQCIGVS